MMLYNLSPLHTASCTPRRSDLYHQLRAHLTHLLPAITCRCSNLHVAAARSTSHHSCLNLPPHIDLRIPCPDLHRPTRLRFVPPSRAPIHVTLLRFESQI
ncbi:unnamed protein product [Citrullus colocynthis]|uniref:Uncharacterized protein n=1 Tax=Citrullus colocynthis TaxID=252529 RepID=A0ABP0YM81_9ROSI